jgi:hypothetical protein
MPQGWGATRARVLHRDGYVCQWCAALANVADHIIARALGGGDDDGNLQALCPGCSARKTNGEARIVRALNARDAAALGVIIGRLPELVGPVAAARLLELLRAAERAFGRSASPDQDRGAEHGIGRGRPAAETAAPENASGAAVFGSPNSGRRSKETEHASGAASFEQTEAVFGGGWLPWPPHPRERPRSGSPLRDGFRVFRRDPRRSRRSSGGTPDWSTRGPASPPNAVSAAAPGPWPNARSAASEHVIGAIGAALAEHVIGRPRLAAGSLPAEHAIGRPAAERAFGSRKTEHGFGGLCGG